MVYRKKDKLWTLSQRQWEEGVVYRCDSLQTGNAWVASVALYNNRLFGKAIPPAICQADVLTVQKYKIHEIKKKSLTYSNHKNICGFLKVTLLYSED